MRKKDILLAKNGDKQAFEKIIRYYQDDLYKIARVRLSSDEDINDAVQETIISIYESLHQLRNISKFKSWMITILINKCNLIYKKNTLYNRISSEISLNNETFTNDIHCESNLEFFNIIDKLDLDERTILILHFVENYKFNEIAKILNMNSSTIRTKMFRAKLKIKQYLKEDYDNE